MGSQLVCFLSFVFFFYGSISKAEIIETRFLGHLREPHVLVTGLNLTQPDAERYCAGKYNTSLSAIYSETELGVIAKGLLPKLVLQTIGMAWIQGIATGAQVVENTTLYGVAVQPSDLCIGIVYNTADPKNVSLQSVDCGDTHEFICSHVLTAMHAVYGCVSVDADMAQCGWDGIDKDTCKNLACCYQPSGSCLFAGLAQLPGYIVHNGMFRHLLGSHTRVKASSFEVCAVWCQRSCEAFTVVSGLEENCFLWSSVVPSKLYNDKTGRIKTWIKSHRPSWDCQIGVAVNREASHEVQPPAIKPPAQCLAECDALPTCEFVQLMPAEDDATYCHQYSKTYQVFDSAGCSTGSPRCYYCYPGPDLFTGNDVPLAERRLLVDGNETTCHSGESLLDPYSVLRLRIPMFGRNGDNRVDVLGSVGLECNTTSDVTNLTHERMSGALFVYVTRNGFMKRLPRLPFYGEMTVCRNIAEEVLGSKKHCSFICSCGKSICSAIYLTSIDKTNEICEISVR